MQAKPVATPTRPRRRGRGSRRSGDQTADVPALDRGLTVLEAIARSRTGLGYGELGALGIPSASLVRILRTLHRRGFLRQPPGTNRYRLGLRLHAFGMAALASLEVVQEASAVLPRLPAETGETAELVLLDGDELTWAATPTRPAAPASRPAPRPPGGTPGG
jgi:DNA-binding IclR family transcriptional regulator